MGVEACWGIYSLWKLFLLTHCCKEGVAFARRHHEAQQLRRQLELLVVHGRLRTRRDHIISWQQAAEVGCYSVIEHCYVS